MSLSSFINQRLQQLHNDAQAVINPVVHAVAPPLQRTVVAPIQRDVVAPVVHAAGNTVNALSMHSINKLANSNYSPVHLAENMVVKPTANAVIGAGTGIGNNLYNHVEAPVFNLPKEQVQTVLQKSNNPLLRNVGHNIGTQSVKQQVGNAAVLGLSAIPEGGKLAEIVGGKVAGATADALGATASKVAGKVANYGVKTAAGAAGGYGYGAGTALQDNATLKQANKAGVSNAKLGAVLGGGGSVVADVYGPAIQKASEALQAAHLTRPSNLSNSEVVDLNNFMHAQGTSAMTGEIQQKAAAAAQKAGIDINNPKQVNDLIGAHMTHATVVMQRAQTLQNLKNQALQFAQDHPLGMSSGAVDGEGNKLGLDGKPLKSFAPKQTDQPHQAFEKEYADSLKQMDSGMTGGQLKPDGNGGYTRTSDHSPFYRQTYKDNGNKPPTKAQWLAEAQRQLQSGKADSYAQKEYDHLKSPEFQSLAATEHKATGTGTIGDTVPVNASHPSEPVNANALKQSKVDEAPTAIKDALLAKQQKLQAARSNSATSSLPKALRGAKPNYSIGQNRYSLNFPDDVTKSLYIVGGKGQSASHAAYMAFLHQALPGKSDAELAAMGNQVRGGIKAQAQHSMPGTLNVKSHPAAADAFDKSFNLGGKSGSQPGTPPLRQPAGAAMPTESRTASPESMSTKGKSGSLPNDTTKTGDVKATPVMPEGNKQSRFANVTVQNSDKVNPNVKQLVAEKNTNYTPQSVEDGQKAAQAVIKREGLTEAKAQVIANLHGASDGKITRQDVYNAHAVADALQKTGKPGDAAQAADIYGRLSEHHTAAGQQIQAAAAIAKISPQGLHQSAIKAIENGGKNGAKQKISDDLAGKISDKVSEIADAAQKRDGLIDTANKATDPAARNAALKDANTADIAHNDRVQELQKIVNQNVHHSIGSKLFTLWRTGLLTGPQTITKVGLSHAIMATAEKAKDVPAVAIDKAISGGSRLVGKGPMRSTALTMRGSGSGFKTGLSAAGKLLKTGLDTTGTGGMGDTLAGKLAHPEVDYGNSAAGKVANFYVQKVGQIHASIPKGFFTAAQSNDLFKQAIAEGKNMGLSGRDLQLHVDNYTQGASDFAKQEAQLSAQRSSFQQDTSTGKVGRSMQSVPGGKWVMPFAKIASTILSDAADYSPVGTLKAGWQAFKEGKGTDGWTPTVQKHFVEELGRSITGTGVIAAGVELYKHGVMTLGYPTSKPEQAIWKAQGKTQNSIYINGQWRDTSSLGPFGTLLFMGGSIAQSGGKDGKGRSQVGAAATGALQNITSQSYLSGLTSAANAISDPTQFAGSEEKQLAGSVVPIAVSTTARATDPLQRNAPGVAQSVESKIPGLRESLTPAQDMFGHNLQRQGGVTANILDPSRPSGINAGPQVQELQRLENKTGTTAVPAAVTSISGKNANGKTMPTALNQKQQNAFTAQAGPQIQAAYKQIMNDPRYSQLTDANKTSVLDAAKTDIEATVKAQMLKSINGNTVKLTTAQANNVQPDYIQNKLNEQSGGTAGTPINPHIDAASKATLNAYNGMTAAQRTKATETQDNFAYKYALAKYNNDVANGTLTDAQKVKAQTSLLTDSVGANYSANVRDLYGLSNAELTQYLNTPEQGVDKQALYTQIMSYGDALASAGAASKNKFRTSKGVADLGKTTSTGSNSSKKSAKFKVVKMKAVKNPYSTSKSKQSFKQAKMPKIKSATIKGSYKTAKLTTNIDAKLKSKKA